jgi:1-acyl-sn-glycerol-3-phosphate acyltransferase
MSQTPSQAARRAGNTGPAPESASITEIIKDRLLNTGQSDKNGFDRELNDRVFMAALRPLAEVWFRTQVRGIENIPNQGAALVAGNHSGAIGLDALMTQLAIFDTHPYKRHIHMLAADLVFDVPIVKDIARAAGHTNASPEEAMRLLGSGKLVGVWPEGFSGVGKTWMRRYELQHFGKGGFITTAREANVPLIPLAIVGAEEAYPMVANVEPLAKLFKLPYFPITPTFPLLGPLGVLPLPSKWIIQFGKPIPPSELPSQYDEKAVLDFAHHFRGLIQNMVDELIIERGNPWV